jgi:hypothetical protein
MAFCMDDFVVLDVEMLVLRHMFVVVKVILFEAIRGEVVLVEG